MVIIKDNHYVSGFDAAGRLSAKDVWVLVSLEEPMTVANIKTLMGACYRAKCVCELLLPLQLQTFWPKVSASCLQS